MSTPFSHRYLHQLRTELRLALWPALILACALLARLHFRLPADRDARSPMNSFEAMAKVPLLILGLLLPAWIVFRSIQLDAPSNSNTASLTRPIGAAAMWWAKLSAFLLVISLPWWLCDVIVCSIPQHSLAGWLAITAGSLGNTLSLIFLTAAVCSLAGSQRQLITIVCVGMAAGAFWLLFSGEFSSVEDEHLKSQTRQTCAIILGGMLLFIFELLSWRLSMISRQRRGASLALITGFLAASLVARFSSFDWLARPEHRYDHKLTLKLGPPSPGDKAPGRALWPTLRIAGLGKDEVATVLAFAPVEQGKDWPAGPFTTDYQIEQRWTDLWWMKTDFVRPIMAHFASTDLWNESYNSNSFSRPALAKLVTTKDRPWRLRLAMHELRLLGECPLREVFDREQTLYLSDGKCVKLGPSEEDGRLEIRCGIQESSSSLLPTQAHAPMRVVQGYALPANFMLVARDAEAREISFKPTVLCVWYVNSTDSSLGLLHDSYLSSGGNLWLDFPWPRIALGLTTKEHWVNNTTLQLWTAEERGTMDFELSAEQMQQVRAGTDPPKKQP